MDTLGYKQEEGETWFSWIFINTEDECIWLNGKLGELTDTFMKLSSDFNAATFHSKAIPMLEGLGYQFDFNTTCKELLIRFELCEIENLYEFRFEQAEPLAHALLQRTGNGFCDTGFCDQEYLYLLSYVYSIPKAIESLEYYLDQVESLKRKKRSYWLGQNGLAVELIK